MKHRYLAILHSETGTWEKLSAQAQQETMAKFRGWAGMLREKYALAAAGKLGDEVRELRRQGGSIQVDGPFPETKEVLTGYFVFDAASIEDAVAATRECPALDIGDWVRVYELPNQAGER